MKQARKPVYAADSLTGFHSVNGYENEENTTFRDSSRQDLNEIKVNKNSCCPTYQKSPQSIQNVSDAFYSLLSLVDENKAFIYHKDKYGNVVRKIRSECRKTIYMIGAFLVQFMDARTLEIGYEDENGRWVLRSYDYMAKRLGISLQQFKRVMRLLKKYGYISIRQFRKMKDGKFSSKISRKVIHASFFIDALGQKYWDMILGYRRWLEKKRKPQTRKEKQNSAKLNKMAQNAMNSDKTIKTIPKPKTNLEIQRDQQCYALASEMAENDPEKRGPRFFLNLIREGLSKR
jgi:hypothetical protein